MPLWPGRGPWIWPRSISGRVRAKYRRLRIERGLAEYNLRVVVTGAATLNPKAEIFSKRFSPIIVLASGVAPERKLKRLEKIADEVAVFGDKALDFRAALEWLNRKWGVKRLLCEGGGEVNAALFERGLVNEIHQTVCPLVFGGRAAPTMADGFGVQTVAQGTRFRLKSLRQVGDELFLIYTRAGDA